VLPLLMLVWVNVHGGFLVGFVLLGIFFISALWTWFRADGNRIETMVLKAAAGQRVRGLAGIGLLSLAATLVNPYGWKLHAHIYSYLSNRFLMDHIDEFSSPNFHGVAQKCFLALLLITLAVLAVKVRALRVSAVLIVLFAVCTGLYASRNIPVSSILLALSVAPCMPVLPLGGSFFNKMTALEAKFHGHVWPIIAIVATLAIAVYGGRVGSNLWMDAHFSSKRMPVDAVTYMDKHAAHGPVLSPDYWGGYLIYRLYPKWQVVVDDRHDLYGEDFLKDYLKMVHGEKGWDRFLHTHVAACLLLPRDAALTNLIFLTKGWKEIYADDVAVAFVRDPETP
jgi:hypothetical protein